MPRRIRSGGALRVLDHTILPSVFSTAIFGISYTKHAMPRCGGVSSLPTVRAEDVRNTGEDAPEFEGVGWQERGRGEAILFLHPIIGTSDYWAPQLRALSDQFRCIAVDSPGYRDSSIAEEPMVEAATEQLIALLDHLEIERAHVVGLSLGGMQAQHAALHHPTRFDRVVLADTSAAFGADPDEWLAGWLSPLDEGGSVADVVGSAANAIVHQPLAPETRLALTESAGAIPGCAFEQASRVIAGHNLADRLGQIQHPCLVVVGEHDGETPLEYSHDLVAAIPNAALDVIPGVGHLSSLEDPERFNAAVRSFLSPNSSPDGGSPMEDHS